MYGTTQEPTYFIKDDTVDIKVFKENGIYVLDRQSATGKTYLYTLLERYRRMNFPVLGVTYEGKGYKRDISTFIHNTRLSMFDRFDMYRYVYTEEILELSKHGIVLLDYKTPCVLPYPTWICGIKLNSPFQIELR